MKIFTKQNFKTNPLWIRLLIMAFMLLAGAGNAWAAWYLKGGFNSWNTNNELKGSGNDLTTTVELKSGSTYAFKIHNDAGNNEWYGNSSGTITSDCTWTFSGNDGDAHITASVSGLYTFTFNKSTKALTVVYPKPTYLLGTLTDWTNGSELPCSINLQANTAYEFKIKQGDTWYGNGGTMTADNSKGWTFGSDNGSNCHIQTSLAGDYYFSLLWEGNIPSISVSYPCDVENSTKIRIECISTSGCPNLHAWTSNSESITGDWPGKAMNREGNTNIYYYEIERETYKGSTVNIIFNGNNEPQTADITELEWGKVHRYTRGGVLVYSDCLPEDCTTAEFSVNSLSNLAVGCTATASITGDNVTVTWSSSETSVASIDPNTGFITAETAGETTITATTTDADGFCAGVVKETTLIVKSPSVLVEANKTSLCAGEELILTATVTNAGTGNTYQWYKGDNSISGATSAKYTINSVSTDDAATYKVAVSGGILCQAKKSAGVTVTVNPIPSAPTFTTNSAQVCSGVAFNLNEKFPRNSGEAGTLTWYKASDNSQVTNPASVTITEVTSYYAKATNNNCTSDKSLNCTVNVDTKPILELASTPTVCPNVEIDLDNYVTSNTGTLTWYSNQERTTVITDGLVTPTEQTTYYAKVINGTCTPVEKEFTVNVYGIADDMPAYTSTPATSCKGTPNSDGTITLKNAVGGVTYALDGTNGTEWSGLAAGTHTLSALVDACPSLTKVWDVVVEVEYITPTATVSITGESSFCEGDNTELTCEVETTGVVTAYQWYNGDNPIQAATESTYTAKAAGTYKVVVTVENKGCEDTFNATKEVSVKNKPTTPEFTPDFTSICVGGSTTLASGYNWYTELNASALVDLTVSPQTTTTYYATKVGNGCTSDAGEFTVTVNPLPTITEISGNNSAVLYEDVVLTATGVTQGAEVKWYLGNDVTPVATGTTYTVTSENIGEVIVKAKAFLNGCESAVATKTVTFGAEDCNGTTSTDLIITCDPGSYTGDLYCYIFGATTPNVWSNCKGTKTNGIWKWEFNNINEGDHSLIFHSNSKSDGKDCKTGDLNHQLQRGYQYDYALNGVNNNWCNEPHPTTIDPVSGKKLQTITAPAVKMLSAYSEEGSGELSMTAQIVKTGCNGNMTYYFKYRLKGAQAWSQTAAQTATGLKAGDEINETVSGLDQGGTYEIQAVINNNNEAVSNILEYVVNIQETEISNVSLQLADEDGNVLQNQNQIYCVGSTAYIKLSYAGTAHKSLEWIAENELQPVNGKDKLFSYVVRGDETITANVANNENKGTPATGTIDINVYTIATTPDISIDRTEVCSTDPVGAKITVNAPQIGITYQAYKKVGDVETTHGDAVVADNAESIVINSIKETGTYYVKAWNAECLDAIAVSLLKFDVTKIDASSNTIAISPETASTNPWMPVTVKVDKNSAYDYTLVCKQEDTDVTDQMVINKKGDSYVIKFPKPESAEIDKDGQVVFDDITYNVVATLNGDVQCGTTSATSTVTLTNLIEDCD